MFFFNSNYHHQDSRRRRADIYFLEPGISIIEILLVVAIMAILGASMMAVGQRFLVNNHLDNKTNELVTLLRTARINSMAGRSDSSWGVYVDSSQMTAFSGSNYANRSSEWDLTFKIPSSVSVTSGEVVFTPLTGEPDSALTFTVSGSGQSSFVELNSLGVVNVN